LQEDQIFTGQHLFDFYHIAKNIKVSGPEKWSLIKKLYSCATKNEYYAIVDRLNEICTEE